MIASWRPTPEPLFLAVERLTGLASLVVANGAYSVAVVLVSAALRGREGCGPFTVGLGYAVGAAGLLLAAAGFTGIPWHAEWAAPPTDRPVLRLGRPRRPVVRGRREDAMKPVLVLGGYGAFGGRVCRELARLGAPLTVAGRDGARAAAFAARSARWGAAWPSMPRKPRPAGRP